MFIPAMILKQLYTFDSLKNTAEGVRFSVKNRLSDATLTGFIGLSFNDKRIPLDKITFKLDDGRVLKAADVSEKNPIDFPLRRVVDVFSGIEPLDKGKNHIEIEFDSKPFGNLKLKVDGSITDEILDRIKVPRDDKDDYSEAAIRTRQEFLKDVTGVKDLKHIFNYSFDAHITQGNCEHFTGVAQVPLGIAGPLRIDGEHAKGDFMIPMATAEGTLVASYNRGMKLLNANGGATCSVVDDAMQRAPVFVFSNAREARDFVKWVQDNLPKIREEAESTSRIAKLKYIDPYLANKFAYLRFNYSTGDAAGQNMVGRATFAACSWILEEYKNGGIKNFYLESNLATDKKASQVNVMHTRGKRVIAEAVIKRNTLIELMRVEPEQLAYHWQVAQIGSILSGANNNGAHSANGITALFIATGQDVANVSESSAGIAYTELTPEKDLYLSITIPSLIVATHGGGTKLATQLECLRILGCEQRGSVYKLAEIIAGVVLAGELSLASAISSSDWVSSHEQYGRNR